MIPKLLYSIKWIFLVCLFSFILFSYSGIECQNRDSLDIYLFYSVDCSHCREIKDVFIPQLKERYGDLINIYELDIAEEENYALLLNWAGQYNVQIGPPPTLFVVDNFLKGEDEIKKNLIPIIDAFIPNKDIEIPAFAGMTDSHHSFYKAELLQSKKDSFGTIKERFLSFSTLAVLGAGFIDGLNPCEFTTIVFFLSFLAFSGYKRHEMFVIGLFFIMGVFITYFLIGLGLFRSIHTLQIFPLVRKLITYGVSMLAFGLGFLSFWDYLRWKRTGDVKDMKLQLPFIIKERIHKVIGDGYRLAPKEAVHQSSSRRHIHRLIWTAFWTGIIISILESVCTGQVYLPTLIFVAKNPTLRHKALSYLFLYNLSFIVPLVIIFIVALKGVTSAQFAGLAQRHIGKIKLALAVLFFILGVMLVIG